MLLIIKVCKNIGQSINVILINTIMICAIILRASRLFHNQQRVFYISDIKKVSFYQD